MIETNLTGLELYNTAKEAYYNGQPIMTDIEFDELEASLGLENKSYVGAKRNNKYTIPHPFKMGSLAKVQIKNNNGVIDWLDYLDQINSFISGHSVIITPKFDGCSFEAQYSGGNLVNISSRGDGDYGVDLTQHLKEKLNSVQNPVFSDEYVLRGEVLIDKKKFEQKYSEFVNPRSFVSGVLNKNYSDDPEFLDILNDLSIVIYDVRIKENNTWKDHDWTEFVDGEKGLLKNVPEFFKNNITISSEYQLRDIYDAFAHYRSKCQFALDGIVIKTIDRINNLTANRPSDCVAVKFMPMLEETEVVDIEWNSVKTEEVTPVLIFRTVTMDGKKINRVRGNNYGWLVENKVSIGTKLIVSLAGDIIPFIYKITDTTGFSEDKLNLPDVPYTIDGIHCNLILTEEQKAEKKFMNSAIAIKIPKLGPANAQAIHDWFGTDADSETLAFFGEEPKKCPDNFMLLTETDILSGLGNGVTATAVAKGYKEFWKSANLKDIIIACCFEDCGNRIAEACANYLITGEEDFSSCTKTAYEWIYNTESNQYKYLINILDFHGLTIDYFKKQSVELAKTSESTGDKIPVILTGEPNNYSSKSEFLACHPEYELTGSWKKVQIVFTNSLDSKTGKMKKALAAGVKIEVY